MTSQHVRNTLNIPYPVPSNNGQRCNTNCNDVTTSILGRPAPTGVHAHEDLKTMTNCAWTQGTSGLGRGLRGHLCPDHNFIKSKSSNSPKARPPAMGEAHQQQKQPRMLDHTWPASWAGPACCCWCTRADQPGGGKRGRMGGTTEERHPTQPKHSPEPTQALMQGWVGGLINNKNPNWVPPTWCTLEPAWFPNSGTHMVPATWL